MIEMVRKKSIALLVAAIMILTACGQQINHDSGSSHSDSSLEQGIGAVEEAITAERNDSMQDAAGNEDRREGTSTDTIATPEDFPEEYDYGSGRLSEWSRERMLKKMPEPKGNETVLNTAADSTRIQALYLWEEGNVPAVTEFTENMGGYFDEWNFRPYVTAIPVREGVEPKGTQTACEDLARAVAGVIYTL
ncbi:MAG: hypothetical protein Q4E24_08455 [bacterium]|nr:hypothetical protein [bacterium]